MLRMVLFAFAVYLAGAFAAASFDISTWTPFWRAMCGCGMLIAAAFGACFQKGGL